MDVSDLARTSPLYFPLESSRSISEPRSSIHPQGNAGSALRGLFYGLVFEAASTAFILAVWRLI